MRVKLRRKFRFVFSWAVPVVIIFSGVTALCYADESNKFQAYELLQSKASEIKSSDTKTGWAYIISGGLTLGASIPAYYLSDDLFAKVIYSLGQTLGVAAIGYGSYLAMVDNDYTSFIRVVDSVKSLSKRQKNQLSYAFLRQNARQARNLRGIRVITHSLTAGLNFLNATTSSFSELRIALFFIGGVNTLAALSFALSRSDEEDLADSITKTELLVGPMVGVRFSF